MRHDGRILTQVVLFATLFSAVPVLSGADDRRADPSVLRVMTLNAHFLWDGVGPEEGQVPFSWKHSQTEAEDHMREIAGLIAQADPDIVNLVEVENQQALDRFNTVFLAGRGYKAYFVQGQDVFTGKDVALLTRLDPVGMMIRRDERLGVSGSTKRSIPKHYLASFDLPNHKFTLIGLQLSDGPRMETRRWDRQAEADAIRSIVAEELTARRSVMVMGDFNDFDGAADSLDHLNNMPITSVLHDIRTLKTATVNDDLINVASVVAPSIRYTRFFDANESGSADSPAELSSVDHILLSNDWRTRVESVDFPHPYQPPSVSNHFPVVVQLRLQTAVATGVGSSAVRIASLLPNPSGDENLNEAVTLRNIGGQSVSLSGWFLRNRAGARWNLSGTVPRLGTVTLLRNGQAMAMSNGGDTIDLVNPSGVVEHSVTYYAVDEEQIVTR